VNVDVADRRDPLSPTGPYRLRPRQ
jgi:hypothetical protein